MRSRRFLFTMMLAMLLGMLGTEALAQATWYQGTVVGQSDGLPIPGVNVLIKGTSKGTVTDFDGKFSLDANAGDVLVMSFVGYQTQEVKLSNQTQLSISLAEDMMGLEEIVVIGYGEVKKKDLTGSVEAISTADFNAGPISSPQDLITGKIAGVNITSAGGAPGSAQQIRIRAGSSLNASNDPLIIIDGFPIDNSTIAGMRNPLNSVNPNDIESFTVLKDASATAIYGSRASNGVIIITTKKGTKGNLKVDYSGNVSVNTPTKTVDVLDADQYRQVIEQQYGRDHAAYQTLGNSNTNWQEEVLRTSISTDHNISLSGTVGEKTILPYRASVGYNQNNGILETSSLERITANLNLSPKFFDDHLAVNLNAKGMNVKNRFADTGALGSAIAFDPTQSVYDSNMGRFGGYTTWVDGDGNPITIAPSNPVAMLHQTENTSDVNRFIGNAQFDYRLHFLPDLRFNLNVGMDYANGTGSTINPTTAAWQYNVQDPTQGGYYTEYDQTQTNKLLDFYTQYVKEVPSLKSKFDVMGGYSWQHFKTEQNGFDSNFARSTDDEYYTERPYAFEHYLVSFFGRFNYTFDEKYLLTATLRYDGTSKFGKENRWGLFPSVAMAWNVDKESFLVNSNSISQLKLRAGWGVTGQQDIGSNYGFMPTYVESDVRSQYVYYDPNTGRMMYRTIRPDGYDENLKWEETTTYNVGIDYGFFNDKIYGKIDAYYRETNDMLSEVPVASGSNLTNMLFTNVGSMVNKGIEFSLNTKIVESQDLNIHLGGNVTYNHSEITKLTLVDDPDNDGSILTGGIQGGTGNMVQIHSVGYAPSSFYLYEQVYDDNGKPIEGAYVDRNGDGKIDDEDRYIAGSSVPKWIAGLNFMVNYKRWTLSGSGHGSFGQYVYNNVASQNTFYGNMNVSGFNSNRMTDVTEVGFNDAQYLSDHYLEKGSFFRMDNIMLSYDFEEFWNGKVKARVFATVNNAFVISSYDGLDPEIPNGIDNNVYPRPRSYMLGVNLSF
ncbi:SusC/RagA family TonB-linked outer membrane protein [Aureibacter tunicatorum]|uniref:Iron complex outermembrane receptor protein n=1 Tax=Aureibacter tunicatorum TaxID=866807 RepID=A0AAE4BRI6_9BACT|nr:TonB-dependent receptor [Aureibacter tunicatorum]MDR6238706.1 iron complex outermembrane receptor protein [Aureibacter tunicatorum]BDD05363.1 SusC/RagA family TonB-linked outer membrane protein [Aureibacter tunicatorum]